MGAFSVFFMEIQIGLKIGLKCKKMDPQQR